MSFWEFVYRNQSYWEEHMLAPSDRPKLKTYKEFEEDVANGVYEKIKMCLPLLTVQKTLKLLPQHREELLEMFNYKMSNLKDPNLWE